MSSFFGKLHDADGLIPKAVFEEAAVGTGVEPEKRNRKARRALRRLEESDIHIALNTSTVHWGYFSKTEEPIITIDPGTEITVEMATHHACDDWDKMIKGDEGLEAIYTWNEDGANEGYRGATGGGDGVHILTGPIFVTGAEPGDILKVEILDLAPRLNADGRAFGSNAAAWWGFQGRMNQSDGTTFDAGDFSETPGSNDEFVTIYEIIEEEDGMQYAVPSYQFEWPVVTDPQGVERNFISYPGTCVPHDEHGKFSGLSRPIHWSSRPPSISWNGRDGSPQMPLTTIFCDAFTRVLVLDRFYYPFFRWYDGTTIFVDAGALF